MMLLPVIYVAQRAVVSKMERRQNSELNEMMSAAAAAEVLMKRWALVPNRWCLTKEDNTLLERTFHTD